MAKKTGRCQKSQYSYPIGDWKGEQNWFSQNLFSAKYSTFATAAPKLWKAQKGVLVLQSQPRWEPSLTDIQVLCTKKKKKLGQEAGFDQAQKYIDAWYHEFVGSH